VNKRTILNFISKTVDTNAEMTADEFRAYNGIAKNRVNHSAGKYIVNGNHTNSIESFWSLFKRGYIGIYHYMSKKHLQRYINEFAIRLNGNRASLSNFDKFAVSIQNINNRLTYERLVNGKRTDTI
jgi:hypothetical protein